MSGVPEAESISTLLGASARSRLLTAAEELALARRIERGDLQAKDVLVEANLRLVVALVRPFAGHGVPLADLVQEGTVGLIRAAEKFDWRRNLRFSTYAAWWIRQAASTAVTDCGSLVRLPAARAREAEQLVRLEEQFAADHGEAPNWAALAAAAGINEARVAQVLSHRDARLLRLDATDEGGRALAEHLRDPDAPDVVEELHHDAERQAISDGITHLTEREAEVLRLRYGLDGEAEHSRSEVAQRFRLSRERVRQIEVRANERLASCPGLTQLCPNA